MIFLLFTGTYFDVDAFVFIANIQTGCESDDGLLILEPQGQLENIESIFTAPCGISAESMCQYNSRSTNANVMWQRLPVGQYREDILDENFSSGVVYYIITLFFLHKHVTAKFIKHPKTSPILL